MPESDAPRESPYELHPHRRYNPLLEEWILVSPHRTQRPWQGQQEGPAGNDRLRHDPKCYLCPGNERAGGVRNPNYETTFVFANDFPALLDPGLPEGNVDGLLKVEPAPGTARVICFSPRHDLTLAEMEIPDIRRVVDLWADQVADLGQRYRWVQVFENKGQAMGASNPHPHGQVWALDVVPSLAAREDAAQRRYFEANGRPLLMDYAAQEERAESRIVEANDHWLWLVPFWASWPYEVLLLPRRHLTRLPDLRPEERDALAEVLRRGLIRYDNLFETSFPYSMGWHGAPFDGGDGSHWQLHAHFYPPLLRSATVRKFMVGFEMLGEPQRDLTPETAAQRLREVPEIHYLQRS